MDKKSIRINFNFNIAKNKNGRNNSHFKTKHYKNKDIDYIEGEIPRYLCKKYCFMYENDFNRTLNE